MNNIIFRFNFSDYRISPKKRHRDTRKGGKYNPSKKKQTGLAWMFRRAILDDYPEHIGKTITCPVNVIIKMEFKKDIPGDVDNYEKLVYDAMQEAQIIKNDKQVWENHTRKIVGDEDRLSVFVKHYDMHGWGW